VNPIVKSVFPKNKGFSHSGLSQFKKIPLYFRNSDFKFVMQLEFAKAHHTITSRKKWAWPCAKGVPQIWGSSLIFLQRLKQRLENWQAAAVCQSAS